jgi:predicted alpha-1,2-mannosidase
MRIKFILQLVLFSFTTNILQAQYVNLAKEAVVKVSSSLDDEFEGKNAVDGIIGVPNNGEWACDGKVTPWGHIDLPWIKLSWDEPKTISQVILYDRPSLEENIAGGKLSFSDGSEIWVRQLNSEGLGKKITFKTKTIEWVKFEATDATGKDIGLSEIEVYAAPEETKTAIDWVDPYIETNRGRYLFFITGSRPFGMVGAAPLTRNKNQYGGGYNYNEDHILGFEQIHSWMLGGLEIMPAALSVDPRGGQQAWKSRFSHDSELVNPGYQRVFLENPKTWVEFTASDRVAFYQFRFTQSVKTQIITNLGGKVSNVTMANASVDKINNQRYEGSFSTVDRFWGGPEDVKVFFVAEFDKPFQQLNGWTGKSFFEDIKTVKGDSSGVAPVFNVKAGDSLKMKISISYTSIENARQNLQAEIPHWDFNRVKEDSREIWDTWLGKIKVEGDERNDKVKFYTDLWHVLLGRQKINDVSGTYPDRTHGIREGNFTKADFQIKTLPKDNHGNLKFNMYNSDAWWLTQWNLNVLWGLAWPEVMDEMSASMVQYAINGGLLPRGPSGGGYSYIMTSSPATNLITSTYQKGLLTKMDAGTAYKMMKKNLLPGGMLGDADDIDFYTKKGYWPGNAGITIEASFQDYALSQMALKLGKEKDYHFFENRSKGWENLFNKDQNLLFPKGKNGEFIQNDPLSGEGWVEANAWQATWSVSQGIGELAQLMGGKNILCDKLNYAFEKAAPQDFVYGYSNGYISYANQPGCSNAHVFNYAGKPWLSQYWVRRVKDQAYSGVTPDLGYGGHDEDQGQMGGVSALMAIGLFSLKGNVNHDPVYEITSPIFDKITITLDPKYYTGKEFIINVNNNSKNNMYIKETRLNGEKYDHFWFPHSVFAKGGTLDIDLDSKPNKLWGLSTLKNN